MTTKRVVGNYDTIKGEILPLGPDEEGNMRGMFYDGTGVSPITMKPEGSGGAYFSTVSFREDSPILDVEMTPLLGQGPPKVSTQAYKAGWERIFLSDKEMEKTND